MRRLALDTGGLRPLVLLHLQLCGRPRQLRGRQAAGVMQGCREAEKSAGGGFSTCACCREAGSGGLPPQEGAECASRAENADVGASRGARERVCHQQGCCRQGSLPLRLLLRSEHAHEGSVDAWEARWSVQSALLVMRWSSTWSFACGPVPRAWRLRATRGAQGARWHFGELQSSASRNFVHATALRGQCARKPSPHTSQPGSILSFPHHALLQRPSTRRLQLRQRRGRAACSGLGAAATVAPARGTGAHAHTPITMTDHDDRSPITMNDHRLPITDHDPHAPITRFIALPPWAWASEHRMQTYAGAAAAVKPAMPSFIHDESPQIKSILHL